MVKISAIIAVVSIIVALFFLSTNMTGNAVANMTQGTSNILGVVFLVIGLIAGYSWMKK